MYFQEMEYKCISRKWNTYVFPGNGIHLYFQEMEFICISRKWNTTIYIIYTATSDIRSGVERKRTETEADWIGSRLWWKGIEIEADWNGSKLNRKQTMMEGDWNRRKWTETGWRKRNIYNRSGYFPSKGFLDPSGPFIKNVQFFFFLLLWIKNMNIKKKKI